MSALGFKVRVDSLVCMLCLPAYNEVLRFTYDVAPADLLTASMAAKPFQSIYLQTSIGGA